jgi:hypothetical protein
LHRALHRRPDRRPERDLRASRDVHVGGNTSTVGLTAGSYNFAFSMTDHGQIGTGDFSNTTPGVTGFLSIVKGTDNYYVSTGNGSQIGSFTLHLTDITNNGTNAGGTSYLINGSLDATVPADTSSGASGTITIQAAFSGY